MRANSKPDNKGQVDFTFSISKKPLPHDIKLQRALNCWNLINQAKWNNEIEDAQANNLITVLTTGFPNVHFELEWLSADLYRAQINPRGPIIWTY